MNMNNLVSIEPQKHHVVVVVPPQISIYLSKVNNQTKIHLEGNLNSILDFLKEVGT